MSIGAAIEYDAVRDRVRRPHRRRQDVCVEGIALESN